jgi:hypothetical protein
MFTREQMKGKVDALLWLHKEVQAMIIYVVSMKVWICQSIDRWREKKRSCKRGIFSNGCEQRPTYTVQSSPEI